MEEKDYGPNVFIDFSVILNSNLENLRKELDLLIALQKKIFV